MIRDSVILSGQRGVLLVFSKSLNLSTKSCLINP